MPRKKNNRKAIQKAKQAAQPKPKRIAMIGHHATGTTGLAMAVLASGILRDQRREGR